MSLERALIADAVAYAGDWIEYLQRSLRIPGVAVAVRHEDEVLLSRAYGFADIERGEEMRTDHIFRIASHSKTFTATAVMLLAERDLLSLDDRLHRWLDWLNDEPGTAGRLRIRHLLSHSGGVIRDGLDAGWWDLRLPFHDAVSLQAAVLDDPPVYSASERFKYSNIGYSLLGGVVEAASGKPYNDFVRAEIVDRLGLASTGPEPDEAVAGRLATGYSSRRYGQSRVPLPHLDTRAMSAATGFYSTAEDLCRYGAAHFLGNEELLTDETKRDMQHEAWKVEGPPVPSLRAWVQRLRGRRTPPHRARRRVPRVHHLHLHRSGRSAGGQCADQRHRRPSGGAGDWGRKTDQPRRRPRTSRPECIRPSGRPPPRVVHRTLLLVVVRTRHLPVGRPALRRRSRNARPDG